MVNYHKATDYVKNQVAVPFATVWASTWAHGLYGEFVKTCHGRLLRGCPASENEVCDSGSEAERRDSSVNADDPGPHARFCLWARQIIHQMRLLRGILKEHTDIPRRNQERTQYHAPLWSGSRYCRRDIPVLGEVGKATR